MNRWTFLKIIYIVVLSAGFYHLFGRPSWDRFIQRAVVVHEDKEVRDKIPTPSVTFCVELPDSWKNYLVDTNLMNNKATELLQLLRDVCKDDTSNIQECVRNRTYSRKEIVLGAYIDMNKKKSLMNPKYWKSMMMFTLYGMCHTFTYTVEIGNILFDDAILFHLNENLNYKVYMHDSSYFMSTDNPITLPRVELSVK